MKLQVEIESYPEWAAALVCGNNVIVRVPFIHYGGSDVEDEASFAMANFLGSIIKQVQA